MRSPTLHRRQLLVAGVAEQEVVEGASLRSRLDDLFDGKGGRFEPSQLRDPQDDGGPGQASSSST